MNKKKVVDKLIGNDASMWTEDDREFLMSLNERQLGGLVNSLASNKVSEKNDGEEVDQDNNDSDGDQDEDGDDDVDTDGSQTVKGKAKTKMTTEKECANGAAEYIANAPAEIREVLNEGLLALNQERQECVTAILANEENEFDKGELSKMSLNALRKLAKLAAKPAQRSVRNSRFDGLGIVENEGNEDDSGEVLGLPSMGYGTNEDDEDADSKKKSSKK